jgi:hypothetical protein
VTRLDELMDAVKAWLEDIGRPVYIGVPPVVPELPWLQIEAEWNNLASAYGLDGLHYRQQYVFVRSVGRSVTDAMWLDDLARETLTGEVPAGASFVLSVTCESCGTPQQDREGRMHVEHKAAFAYA